MNWEGIHDVLLTEYLYGDGQRLLTIKTRRLSKFPEFEIQTLVNTQVRQER